MTRIPRTGNAAVHPLEDAYQSAMRLHQQGQLDQAQPLYEQILRANPTFARAWHLLGVIHHQRGDTATAVRMIEHAVRLDPGRPVFFANLSRMLTQLGLLADSERSLREGVAHHRNDANLIGMLGVAIAAQDRAFEAIPCLQESLRLDPKQSEAALALGWAWAELGRTQDALAAYQHAYAIDGSRLAAVRWATQLPLVYRDRDDIAAWRARWRSEVQRLVDAQQTLEVGNFHASPVFGLAYHGDNEVEHQRLLARLYRVPAEPLPTPQRPAGAQGKIHIAFASAYFSAHTIGKLLRGIITHLSRAEFFVTVLSIGKRHQGENADKIRAAADLYVELPGDWRTARARIAEIAPDILFYPELGMDNLTYTLALERLAPVQCVWWGHPLTTGLATIDHFVSSDWIEPPGAQSHYTETLTPLHAVTYYYRPSPPPMRVTRGELGLADDDHIYLCPQSIYKFHPDFDAVLADILRRDPHGKVVLIRWVHDLCDQLLRDRFAAHMPDVADRIVFVRRFKQDEYLDLLRLADVLLDPLHFGGGNTSYEAFALGLPIVTLPSGYFRGRITFGLYRQMDMLDLVARDESHYVELALRLAQEPEFRAAMCERIRERSPYIFEDMQAVRAFEAFFRQAFSRQRRS